MRAILKNFPTLDPLVIFMNAPVFILSRNGTLLGFVSIKSWGKTVELGTLYVSPAERGKGHAKYLCFEILKQYDEVYLLCKPKMVPIYSSHGFVMTNNPKGIMGLRQKLFNWFIAPFVGYEIVVMKNRLSI